MQINRIQYSLTLLGAIPFIALAIMIAIRAQPINILGSYTTLLQTYSLAISSFLAGTHWGECMMIKGQWHQIILSNMITVVAWIALSLLSFQSSILVFCVIFACLFLQDYTLSTKQILPIGYIKIRLIASIIVIISLLVAGVYA